MGLSNTDSQVADCFSKAEGRGGHNGEEVSFGMGLSEATAPKSMLEPVSHECLSNSHFEKQAKVPQVQAKPGP